MPVDVGVRRSRTSDDAAVAGGSRCTRYSTEHTSTLPERPPPLDHVAVFKAVFVDLHSQQCGVALV